MQPQSRRQDPLVPRMGMLQGWLGTHHTARTCQRAQHGGRGPQTPYGHVSAPQGSPSPDAENQGVEDPPGTLPGLCSAPLTPYLGLDVLVRGSHQTGTAQPQHHHDGEEEAGGQDPTRKARAPVTPHQPPPKKKDEFMAGHGVGTGRGSNCSGVSGRSSPPSPRTAPLHLLGHAAEEVVLRRRGVRVLRLGFAPRLLHRGLLPLGPGAWRQRGDAEPGHPLRAHLPHPPSSCQPVIGCRGARWSPLPPGTLCPVRGHGGSRQRLGAGLSLDSPLGVGAGCGKQIRAKKRVICLALEKSDESQEGLEAPGPPRWQPRPPRTCVGLGDMGAGPLSWLCRLGLQCLRCWILHLGLGLVGRQEKREKGVSEGLQTPLAPSSEGT